MLNLNYDLLAIEGLKEPLLEISSACKKLNINFFIVGAIAKNIWLVANDQIPGGTKDIDFGVCVPDEETYNKLRDYLIYNYKYFPKSENALCLLTPNQLEIDLLPFGEIEKNEEYRIVGSGLTDLKLEGFIEVFENGAFEVKIGEEIYLSCTIPGIVVLKLVAYDDRPEQRQKDIQDIDAICRLYPTLEDEKIWTDHFDLYVENREHNDIAMIVLGREMRNLIYQNIDLKTRIIGILDKAINGNSRITNLMIRDPEKETIAEKKEILINILVGLTEEN